MFKKYLLQNELQFRHFGSPEVSFSRGELDGLVVWEELSGFLLGHVGRNDDVISLLPVDRCGHLFDGSQLKRVNDTDQLVKVATGCGRIQKGKLQLLVRSDDENGTASQWQTRLVLFNRIHHSVQSGNVPAGIGDDWHGKLVVTAICLDVILPILVAVDFVT